MSVHHKLSCATIILFFSMSYAGDWNVSGGVALRDAASTQPNAGYSDKGWSASTSLSTDVDGWNLGGGFSYSLSGMDMDNGSGSYKPSSTSVVAMVSHSIGDGRSVSGTLGYGNSAVNSLQVSGGTTTTYTSRSDFVSSSLALTQSLTLSRRSLALLSARYTYIGNQRGAYTNSAGTTTPSGTSEFGFYTLGAGYNQRFGRLTPYVQVDWNSSDKEFVAGTGNKDYFSINTGLNYRLNGTTNLGVSFSTISGKTYSRDNTIGINLSHAF